MSLNPIQFRYTLGYQEIREAYELAHRSSLRQARWGGVLLIVIGSIVLLVDWKNLSIVGFLMIFMGVYVLIRSMRDLRNWYNREKVQEETYEATIADTGITVRGPTGTGQYEWQHFTGYRNTLNATVIFHPKTYIALPNSALETETLDNLRTVIAANLRPLPDTAEKLTKLQVCLVIAVLTLSIYFLVAAIRDHVSNAH